MYSGEMKCIRFLPGFHEDFMMEGGGHTHTVMYIGGMPYRNQVQKISADQFDTCSTKTMNESQFIKLA